MTAFITQCSRNALSLILVAAALLFPAGAFCAGIEPSRAELLPTEDGYALSAQFNIDLGQRVEEAVVHGIPLYFNLEFEVMRPRWYWTNEHITDHNLTYRLSYHALTQEYRLSTGGLPRSFASLQAALAAMSRITSLPVLEKGDLSLGDTYRATLRLSLDRSKLPKPFQVDAFANLDWQVDSKILRWTFKPGEREAK